MDTHTHTRTHTLHIHVHTDVCECERACIQILARSGHSGLGVMIRLVGHNSPLGNAIEILINEARNETEEDGW